MPYADPERKREYLRTYQRDWIARRRAEWLEGKTCEVCGADNGLVIVAGAKVHGGTIWTMSEKRRKKVLSHARVFCRSHANMDFGSRRHDRRERKRMPTTTPTKRTKTANAHEISKAISDLHERNWDCTPARVLTYIEPDAVIVVVRGVLSEAEVKLTKRKAARIVAIVHAEWAHAWADELRNVIANTIGRDVQDFTSNTFAERDVTVYTFLLVP